MNQGSLDPKSTLLHATWTLSSTNYRGGIRIRYREQCDPGQATTSSSFSILSENRMAGLDPSQESSVGEDKPSEIK